jgi:phosphoglycerate dehydrogenase-like enzyme
MDKPPTLIEVAMTDMLCQIHMATPIRFLNISNDGNPACLKAAGFMEAVRELGELTILSGGNQMTHEQIASHARACDVFLTGWGTTPLPAILAKDSGHLRYICGITGSMKEMVPIELIEVGIPLTNWGDAPAMGVAEGAMALLLSCLKDIPRRARVVREGGYRLDMDHHGGTLDGLNVGIYGCGLIGRKFVELIRPFNPTLRIFDRYAASLPEGVIRVDSLEELFATSQAIVVHAAWTPETEGSVNAALLKQLPDHGIVVNTARGAIIDQAALFAELKSGRLRAGLDVLHPDDLPAGHEARQWDNVVFTAHQAEQPWPGHGPYRRMQRFHRYALDNLRRFVNGEPLLWQMDAERYRRST